MGYAKNGLPSVVAKQRADRIVEEVAIPNSGAVSAGQKFAQGALPWAEQKDSFFAPSFLDPERANGLYPYRLIVISAKTNAIINDIGSFGGSGSNEVVKNQTNTGGVLYTLSAPRGSWEFLLPITPQQLNITDHYAITTTATMRGVVEEHNGIKFKTITASGTTGIWPTRETTEDDTAGQGQALLGGITSALDGIVDSFNTLVDFGKTPPKSPNIMGQDGGVTTGYFQALLLQQFIEQYVMAKKNPENKHWRLVFDCPKTNESFVVTPQIYTVSKNQRSPGESLWNMQFKAWKRVELARGLEDLGKSNLIPLDPNFFQTLNNSLDNARSLMSSSLNLIKAVRADFRKPFDTLRKFTLLIKDFNGIVKAVSDLPNQIGRDISDATKKRSADLEGIPEDSRTPRKVSAILASVKSELALNEGMSGAEVKSGELGTGAKDSGAISPLNKVFDEPEGNYDFLSLIDIEGLELTPKQTFAIEDEIELNSLISIEEIKEGIKEIQDLILSLTNNFGAGDQFFSTIYGRPAPKVRSTPMSIDEFELIAAMEEVVLQLNLMVSTRDFEDNRTQSSLEYVGGLAQDSNIPFNSSATSKKLVPIPFNLTLQQISARYLGDADRYNEIITLNDLRSPYIDEDGFFYSLLSNGDSRQFNIITKENLFIGQKVTLSSATVSAFIRKITAIEKITDSNYLISVDGLDNLNTLTTTDLAKVKAFLPGTVNSQNQIYIPSDIVSEKQSRSFDIPFLNDDTLTSLSKIDWLLEDNGDIVINSFGEAALANGLTNIVQALKMKINTVKGTILSNPDFGMGIRHGMHVTDITVEKSLNDLKNMIVSDPRFSGVEKIEINVLPPDLSITIVAVLANGKGIFPINFTV